MAVAVGALREIADLGGPGSAVAQTAIDSLAVIAGLSPPRACEIADR